MISSFSHSYSSFFRNANAINQKHLLFCICYLAVSLQNGISSRILHRRASFYLLCSRDTTSGSSSFKFRGCTQQDMSRERNCDLLKRKTFMNGRHISSASTLLLRTPFLLWVSTTKRIFFILFRNYSKERGIRKGTATWPFLYVLAWPNLLGCFFISPACITFYLLIRLSKKVLLSKHSQPI